MQNGRCIAISSDVSFQNLQTASQNITLASCPIDKTSKASAIHIEVSVSYQKNQLHYLEEKLLGITLPESMDNKIILDLEKILKGQNCLLAECKIITIPSGCRAGSQFKTRFLEDCFGQPYGSGARI